MKNQPIRINAEALAACKRAIGIPLSDYAAANAAVAMVGDLHVRTAEAHASGMFYLLSVLQDGHIPVSALGDLKITVRGTDVSVGVPGGPTATLGVNPAQARLRDGLGRARPRAPSA